MRDSIRCCRGWRSWHSVVETPLPICVSYFRVALPYGDLANLFPFCYISYWSGSRSVYRTSIPYLCIEVYVTLSLWARGKGLVIADLTWPKKMQKSTILWDRASIVLSIQLRNCKVNRFSKQFWTFVKTRSVSSCWLRWFLKRNLRASPNVITLTSIECSIICFVFWWVNTRLILIGFHRLLTYWTIHQSTSFLDRTSFCSTVYWSIQKGML